MWDKKTDWLTWLHQERAAMEQERKKQKVSIGVWMDEEVHRWEQNGFKVRDLGKVRS